jgi:hypothetical protein
MSSLNDKQIRAYDRAEAKDMARSRKVKSLSEFQKGQIYGQVQVEKERQRLIDSGAKFGRDFLRGEIMAIVGEAKKELREVAENPHHKYYASRVYRESVFQRLIVQIEEAVKE